MRTRSSIINISAGLANQLIITLLSFISRTVFIHILGVEYLGVNGLFTNILAMLSLAEAGIGSSIIYSLYKPVAENDRTRIQSLMNLYRKAYLVIASVVFLLGVSVMPFLSFFVKDAQVDHIHLIFLIFLLNTCLPYLFQHKSSFLNVNQKSYIITMVFSVSSIVSMGLKIAVLSWTKNFIYYLVVECAVTLISSVFLYYVVDRMYPYLKEKVTRKLDPETRNSIIRNIKAIVLQNAGAYLIFGTDNIIISSFVSVAAVGLYSNYNMLIEICRTFINQIFNNLYHSIGNLVAKETKDKIYSVYKVYWLINFWLYSFFAIFLYVILEPFIRLWIGSTYLMSNVVLIVLMVTFYERGMRNSITTMKTTAGIFHEDRYVPLVQAVINLGFSIWLVQEIGIAGVFLGTLISAMAVPFWTTPYFVYRKVFNRQLRSYFATYSVYVGIGVATCLLTTWICGWLSASTWPMLLVRACAAALIPNLVYILLFRKREEFRYLLGIITRLLSTMAKRIKPHLANAR
ncbi:hypothetical protein MJA45_06575 [Paenibacillus aurantius]|uniref:Flippase n=1 Tax=Paenibacillus aurantius TaxID=2918900 RepID=A0AA96LIN5_9BACL|nr:hypothetical protein [Paenibacillus aurantius]WNQ12691.1 hypothetical protein MJA45_06575 [Paenibacillus aurantius]